jgi:hypothetical protein
VRLLTIPPPHLEHLSDYLKREVEGMGQLLTNDAYITNQHKVLVRKSNRKVYSILALAALAIEEQLSDFITGKFINSLWNLVILYPYNNILQVSVLKIFTGVLKAAPSTKDVLLDHYEEYLLELTKTNFEMFRPLIFTFWK